MIKSIQLFIIVSLLIIGGCSARQDSTSDLHTIDFAEALDNIEEVKLSKYAASLTYTPIETSPNALLGDIAHWFTTNDSIMCIVSPDRQKCIHMFTTDGKYLKDIGRKGRGPGEYKAVFNMAIISEMDALMAAGGLEILFYSLKDGECFKKYSLYDIFDSTKNVTTYYTGQKYISYNMSGKDVIFNDNFVYATAGDNTTLEQFVIRMHLDCSIDTIIPLRQTTLGTGMPRVVVSTLYEYNNNINIIHGLQDTIYSLQNNALYPRIIFNFGNMLSLATMPQIKKNHPIFSPNTRHLSAKVAEIVYSSHDIFTETDSFVIGSLYLPKDVAISKRLKKGIIQFIYDKYSRTTKLIKHSSDIEYSGFTNDLDGGMPFWPTKHIGNKLYQFVDAGTFIEMSKKYNSPRMKEIAATLTEDSNPVIIEATLK